MGIKKGSGQPMVSALTFLQCFDTAGWVTGRIFVHEEPVPSYPRGSLPEPVKKLRCSRRLTQVHLENGH